MPVTDILIRDISEEVAARLSEKAAGEGMDRMSWLRAQLVRLAETPVIRKKYTLRAFGPGGAYAQITRRWADGTIQRGARNCSQEQFEAYQKAALYCERNEIGDYEQAYKLLADHFEEVIAL